MSLELQDIERDAMGIAVLGNGRSLKVIEGPSRVHTTVTYLHGFNGKRKRDDQASLAVIVAPEDAYAVECFLDRRRCARTLKRELGIRGLDRLVRDRETFRALVEITADIDDDRKDSAFWQTHCDDLETQLRAAIKHESSKRNGKVARR
jgi:hypothetical protein